MSARFWLFSCLCAGASLTGGYGLGLYATTSPNPGVETPLPETAVEENAPMNSADLVGPTIIQCKGCGPTLADRQMAADYTGWDGRNDPVVRDYAAQDGGSQADYADSAPGRPTPVSINRAPAAGEDDRQPVRIAQIQNSKTSAEEAAADAAVSY